MIAAAWAPIDETLMASSHIHQRIKHVLYRRHHPRIGGIGILQSQQIRHFLIDIDAGNVVETLL